MTSREPLPQMAGMYFLEPTVESIEALMADYKLKTNPQYRHAYLCFTSAVPDDLMMKLKNCSNLIHRTKSFLEVNIDFIAAESKSFHMGLEAGLVIPALYFPDPAELKMQELRREAQKLVSVCLTMKEQPFIRYAGEVKSGITKIFAGMVEKELETALRKLTGWAPSEDRKRGVVLILDRSMDPVAPLMHEYTYQAMVNDLLEVKGELVDLHPEKKTKGDEDTLVLSEEDPLWMDFRHQHIGTVMEDVSKQFKDFKETNAAAKLQRMDKSSALIKDVTAALKDVTKYQQLQRQFTKHLDMAGACSQKLKRDKLMDIGEFEQDMATGLDNDGKKIVPKKMKQKLVTMCQDSHVGSLAQLRLLMIFLISQGGIQEHTRRELTRNIPPKLQKAVLNLTKLGVDLAAAFKGSTEKHSKARMEELKRRSKDIPLALMRYIPIFHGLLQLLLAGQLPESSFPYTSPPPPESSNKKKASTAALRPQWRSKGPVVAKTEKKDENPRFIVYVLGGVTFSEIRSAYEVGAEHKDKSLYIGAPCFLTAASYVQGLTGLPDNEFSLLVSKAYTAPSLGDDSDDD
eukprot:gb/GEZN01003922.1/.p1 GENE.gb/GEZN01003922.1/~~gb/GEZN01003922.1/.p1  ORF type:complete len:659 (-),score=109.43 gb/GEZN01003922.1/:90-1805(-)